MSTGIIKFFNPAKKFGFITPDDGGKDVFLPAAAVADIEAVKLKAGQRVSFDREPDPRGEKATKLKLLKQEVVRAPSPPQHVELYLDSATPNSDAIKEAVCATKHRIEIFDYARVPLTIDQLKRLASMLTAAGQNIVSRYHPMFLELRLDDRFISEADYWSAIAEHPALIDGPIVVAEGRASICKSVRDVDSFTRQGSRTEAQQKPKKISARLAAMIGGQPVMPAERAEHPSGASASNASDLPSRKTAAKAAAPRDPKAKTDAKVTKKKAPAKTTLPAPTPKKASAKSSTKKVAKPKIKTAKKAKTSTRSERRK
jgi:cold shock CspA family protein/arsenate reductase-like glutaredoxin family protein